MIVSFVLSGHGINGIRSDSAGVSLVVELVHEGLQWLVRGLGDGREWDGGVAIN